MSNQRPATIRNENLHTFPKEGCCVQIYFFVKLATLVAVTVDYHVDLVFVPVVKVHI